MVVAVERAVKKPQEEAHKEKNIRSQEKEQSPPTNSSTDRKRRHSNPFSLTTEIERNFLLRVSKISDSQFSKKKFQKFQKKKRHIDPHFKDLKSERQMVSGEAVKAPLSGDRERFGREMLLIQVPMGGRGRRVAFHNPQVKDPCAFSRDLYYYYYYFTDIFVYYFCDDCYCRC